MNSAIKKSRHPLVWVPSLYFAEGLPYAVVSIMAAIMYKKMGISNAEITYWTSLIGFAWVFKPLWSPFLEIVRSKKAVIIAFQVLGGLTLLATAYSLRLPGFFTVSIALLALAAFSSATHDIAADGLYIENLSTHEQALYSGWLGTFWNGGKLFVQGGLVWLAGHFEATLGVTQGWQVVMALPGAVLLALAAYHMWAMPPIKTITTQDISIHFVARTLKNVLIDFFKKPSIWVSILFIILFRAGEGQVQTVGRLFLVEARETGGLGLSTADMGIAYGVSSVAFMVGSIFGGYFAAWRGLKKSMVVLILVMNVPNLTFWFLSAYLPTNFYLITAVLSLEMLGYGFGFVGLTLYMMQVVAPGKYPTAHYALATGIMQLGFLLSQMVSGDIQEKFGYHNFFIWGVLCALPVLIMALVVKIDVKEKGGIDEETSTTLEAASSDS